MTGRKHCNELLSILDTFKSGLKAPLEEISENHLNHVFAAHKMTIGQIAIHCAAWARYFLSDVKPWEVVPWTCRPCEYPLTIEFVNSVIDDGYQAIKDILLELDDNLLEVNINGEKGHGYIIARLLLHTLSHSNQMAYLRQLLDPEWQFGTHFGDMATAFVGISYTTTRDLSIPGF